LVEEMAAAASSLKNQAQELVQTVAVFNLGQQEHTYRSTVSTSASRPGLRSSTATRTAYKGVAPRTLAAPLGHAASGRAEQSSGDGNVAGINLDNAIEAHANWRTKLRTAAMRKEQMDVETAERDDCCELGKWLQGAGQSKFGGKPSFVHLIDAHREFHQEAGKVARLINQGAYDVAEQQLSNNTAFSTASNKVGAAVVQLKNEIKKAFRTPFLKTPALGKPMAKPTPAGDDDWTSF
jgi:methyl-accepting chemotaxis protein